MPTPLSPLHFSSTELSDASMNNVSDFDAIVDDSFAGNSGSHFTTLTAALAAGAKSVLVKSGTYNEAVTVGSNVRIVGEAKSSWGGSSFSGGVIFQQTMTISGTDVVVENIAVDAASLGGFSVSGARVTLRGCQACGCASVGALVIGGTARLYDCNFSDNGTDGLSISSNGGYCFGCVFDSNDSGDGVALASGGYVAFIGCAFTSNDEYGLDIDGTVTAITGCVFASNTDGATSGTTKPATLTDLNQSS